LGNIKCNATRYLSSITRIIPDHTVKKVATVEENNHSITYIKKFVLSLIFPFGAVILVKTFLVLKGNNYHFSREVTISILKYCLVAVIVTLFLALLFFIYTVLQKSMKGKS